MLSNATSTTPLLRRELTCSDQVDIGVKATCATLSVLGYTCAVVTTIAGTVSIILTAISPSTVKPTDVAIFTVEMLAVETLGPTTLAILATGTKALVQTCRKGCEAGKRVFSQALERDGLIRMTFCPPIKEIFKRPISSVETENKATQTAEEQPVSIAAQAVTSSSSSNGFLDLNLED